MIFTIVVLTVLLSVIAHGLSANPAAKRYGARLDRARKGSATTMPEHVEVMVHPTRGTIKK
jgi:NhaP-type Na+/H+ or K+/H+ antiporter